ncbi:MAG: thermonuclease family protein [Brevinematales bacterium]
MPRQTRWFIHCFLLILLLGCETSPRPSFEAICVKVIDGDTCVFEKEGKFFVVRLVGIDAWELSYNQRLIRQVLSWKRRGYGISYKTACLWGTNGWKTLQQMIPEKTPVHLVTYGKDHYNRTLASLYLSNQWINEKMIESGWAMTHFASNEIPTEEKSKLLHAEKKARKYKHGMWEFFDK